MSEIQNHESLQSIIHNVVVSNTAAQPFSDETPGEQPVRGFLHPAAKSSPSDSQSQSQSNDGLVLTHGAGGNCNAPLLVALAESFSAAGVSVLRCDLPFRQKRPHGPPSPANATLDQEGLRRAVTVLRKLVVEMEPGRGEGQARLFLGGQSYGGRQASMLAASEPSLVDGLLLLSYPLHPPGRPMQIRTAHFLTLRTPALFVHGTTDPLGSLEEMESAVRLIPAQTRLLPVQGVGHSLMSMSKNNRNNDELVSAVVEASREFFQ